MPPRNSARSKPRSAGQNGSSKSTRATRSGRSALSTTTSSIYDEMIAEASATDTAGTDRPLKRRKIATKIKREIEGLDEHQIDSGAESHVSTASAPPPSLYTEQTIDASDSEQSDEDFDFEDVDLNTADEDAHALEDSDHRGIADVSITVNDQRSYTTRTARKRRPVNKDERERRLFVHRLHLACLVAHVLYRNHWCNDHKVQATLRPMVDPRVVSNLTIGPEKSQFERDRWFLQGLQEIHDAFKLSFKVTTASLSRPQWSEDVDVAEFMDSEVIDRSSLQNAARKLEGSQDTGNTLFCALLRSIGVNARLVCSLQPLPLGRALAKVTESPLANHQATYHSSSTTPIRDSKRVEDEAVKTSARLAHVPSVRHRLGTVTPEVKSSRRPVKPPQKTIKKLSYPIFWVEAFNAAYQKWIPVDPIVTHTVDQAAKLEPPISYSLNQLSYAIAVESDGVSRDVTRRYTKAFNAKTRRSRIDSTPEGAEWYENLLRPLQRRGPQLDQDQVETAELSRKAGREGMPTNVQDFKDHPFYVLERHVRRNEVLHPKRQVGKMNAGTNVNPKMEAVFRRQDVVICRSIEKWYRLGREVKRGEQPLKHVPTRKLPSGIIDEDGEMPDALTALYSEDQTQEYIPPPVVNGRVPRNAFGNLDVYVPSMVPAGGVHITHDLAQQAARILRIDYADAVTGFKFKGRKGTAVIEGVVVATEHEKKLLTAIEQIQIDKDEEESVARSVIALTAWKRFLTVLRVRERISEYGELSEVKIDVHSDDQHETMTNVYPEEVRSMLTAGQYSLTQLKNKQSKKKRAKLKKRKVESESEEESDDMKPSGTHEHETDLEGGFIIDDDDIPTEDNTGGGFIASDGLNVEDDAGGGFVAGDQVSGDDSMAGGFVVDGEVPDDESESHLSSIRKNDTPDGVSDVDTLAAGFLLDKQMEAAAKNHTGRGTMIPNPAVLKDIDSRNDVKTADNLVTKATYEGDGHRVQLKPGDQKAPIPSLRKELREKEGTPLSETTGQRDRRANKRRDMQNSDVESEKESLLSHDPEDEDAEPDWLESD